MRCSLVVFVMLLASAGLSAQTQYRLPPVPFMASPAASPEAGGCPVGFSVVRSAATGLAMTKGATEGRSSQSLEIKLGGKDAAAIVSAVVTVHGHSAKLRVLPVGSGSDVPNGSFE